MSFVDAALGAEITVEKPGGGTAKIKIPAGLNSGEILVVRGGGIKHQNMWRSDGDLHCKMIMQTPTNLTPAQKKLIKENFSAAGKI